MQPTTRRVTARQRWVDGALILVLAGASLVWGDYLLLPGEPSDKVLRFFGSAHAWNVYVVWWWLTALPSAVAIVLRHRWPLTATLMAAASAGIHLLDADMPMLPMDLAVLVAVYTLAGSAGSRRSVITVLIGLEAFLYAAHLASWFGLTALGSAHDPRKIVDTERLNKVMHAIQGGDLLPLFFNAAKTAAVPALLLAATWAVADSTRNRRAHLAVLQARAEDLEREQRQRTALAVAAERGRITRELHDVVAHGLSVMVVQAQGARAMLNRQPERTDAALTAIVTTGRGSLAEMRRLLGLARNDQQPELVPQPTLAMLPELIDRVRHSGTPVDLHVTGEPATLPAVIELAAYRIVQEALTNTIKHAPPGTSCTVDLDFGSLGLTIRISDRGGPVPSASAGNGLRGIAERVHALGGQLHTGTTASGFEVSALLPHGTGESVWNDAPSGFAATAEHVA